MKYAYLLLTILFHYTSLRLLEGKYIVIISIFVVCVSVGLIIKFAGKNEAAKVPI